MEEHVISISLFVVPSCFEPWHTALSIVTHPTKARGPDRYIFETDYARVPQLGHGPVVDAVHHLLHLALSVHTAGHIEEIVDADYVTGLHWYNEVSDTLDDNDA